MDDVLERAEMLLRTRNTDALALVQTVEALAAEVRALRARAERAERLAVWAANNVHGVMLGNRGRTEIHFWAPDGVPESVTCDGTDADIYRALREAMGASEGGDERARAAQREG